MSGMFYTYFKHEKDFLKKELCSSEMPVHERDTNGN